MKICTIVGARPQFIKAAAVSRAIAAHNRQTSNIEPRTLNEVILHTGQHYDDGMSAVFFRELEIPEPKYNLAIGSGAHGAQTGQMLAAIEKVLIEEKPDWVLRRHQLHAGRRPGRRQAPRPHRPRGGGPSQLQPAHAGRDQPGRCGPALHLAVLPQPGRRGQPCRRRHRRKCHGSTSSP